ncbi:MAG: FHA domain-containing protein, partial [Chloroflexi bacterium]|nr:FHA domain-containing protein [Chloroflexota bacterium]
TDLNSGNGTFINNVRLNPNEPVIWIVGTPLQIGDVLLQLEQGQFQPQTMEQPVEQSARRERQSTDTIAGWVPTQNQKGGAKWLWLGILILVGLGCTCAALGAGGYFIFSSS